MAVPVKYYTFVDSQADAGKLTAARLNGDFDPLYACLDPATGGLEDTNVKAGAKIVCTDRAHTVTGVWTFTTAPVLPAASVPNAALQSSVMLKTTYDADLDGRVSLAVDSDTVDGSHAAAFAPAAEGVTNGNSHDHQGGDGASLTIGHALAVAGGYLAYPTDGTTYYFGGQYEATISITAALHRMYCPKAGTIKAAYIFWRAGGTPGTAENLSLYIRLNNTTDTLIATISDEQAVKVFSNTALSIAVAQGDYIEIKMVSPTWSTEPSLIYLSGVVYIE
jgi:hypothetical protein